MSIKAGNKDLFPYLGDYRPINIYKGEHKLAGWKWAEQSSQEVNFESTYNDFVHVEIDGKSVQEGEPTPDYPIEIHSLNDFDVVSSTEKLAEGQLEEYDYDTEYENIYKINLSLSEPLRSVGGVKDRLFRDSDGLWKVERNVGERTLENEHFINYNGGTTETFSSFKVDLSNPLPANGYQTSKCSHFQNRNAGFDNPDHTHYSDHYGISGKYFMIENSVIGILSTDSHETRKNKLEEWLQEQADKGTPVALQYVVESPIVETLDQELQGKLNNLRSFQDSNYVYTIINEADDLPSHISESLKPTIHAQWKVKDI